MTTHEQIDRLAETQLWDAVCLATKKCPECHGQGYTMPNYQNCSRCSDALLLGKEPIRRGPGRVWTLPGIEEVP